MRGELVFELSVRGQPAPQGSKRHVGNGRMIESSAAVKPWREAVRSNAEEILKATGAQPVDGPLVVDLVLTMVRPRSHYRTGKNAHLLKDDAPTRPMSAPDLSKLARSTEDAFTDAGVWKDDSRVVEYGRLAKVWVSEDPDALPVAGGVIRVWRYAPDGPPAAVDTIPTAHPEPVDLSILPPNHPTLTGPLPPPPPDGHTAAECLARDPATCPEGHILLVQQAFDFDVKPSAVEVGWAPPVPLGDDWADWD